MTGEKYGVRVCRSFLKRFRRHTAFICVSSMAFTFLFTGCSQPTQPSSGSDIQAASTEAAGTQAVGEAETDVIPIDGTTAAPEASADLTESDDAELKTLFDTYFTALAKGDTESLDKIMVNVPDKNTMEKEHEYIEKYENIKCYSKDGLLDGTKVAYVYYEVKFKNIDTLAPSMIREYICTNEDGKIYINNGAVDGEVATWLDEVQNSESTQKLVAEVNEKLKAAASSDEKLTALIASLNEGAGKPDEVAKAEDTTAKAEESSKAESSKDESSKAETSKEETSKAESSADKTTESTEASAEETTADKKNDTKKDKEEYKAFEATRTMYCLSTLNVRSKADKDSEALGKLAEGNSVKARGTKGKWTRIKFKGGAGYILSELLSDVKPSLNITFKKVNQEVEAIQNVRIRRQPSSKSTVIGTLAGGSKATRIGYTKEWSQILYKGKIVYVSSEFVKKTK